MDTPTKPTTTPDSGQPATSGVSGKLDGDASRRCAPCRGTGDRYLDRNQIDIPDGMECGADIAYGPYVNSICGELATWRDTAKRAGDGMYDSGDASAFICERHLIEREIPSGPEDPEHCATCGGSGRIA